MTLDLAAIRAYVQVPATVLPDVDLQRMWDAAASDQAQRCTVPETVPAALDQALLRRIQREIAAKNLPLGMVGLDASEYGPGSIPVYDALVEQHERGFRTQVLS